MAQRMLMFMLNKKHLVRNTLAILLVLLLVAGGAWLAFRNRPTADINSELPPTPVDLRVAAINTGSSSAPEESYHVLTWRCPEVSDDGGCDYLALIEYQHQSPEEEEPDPKVSLAEIEGGWDSDSPFQAPPVLADDAVTDSYSHERGVFIHNIVSPTPRSKHTYWVSYVDAYGNISEPAEITYQYGATVPGQL